MPWSTSAAACSSRRSPAAARSCRPLGTQAHSARRGVAGAEAQSVKSAACILADVILALIVMLVLIEPGSPAAIGVRMRRSLTAFVSRRDHSMNRWKLVAFACHRTHEGIGIVERRAAAGQVGEGKAPARQQVEGGAVGGAIHAKGAEDAQLLEDDQIRPEAGGVRRPACAGKDD